MRLPAMKGCVKFASVMLIGAGSASALYGDSMVVTYAPAKTQAPVAATLCGSDTICWMGDETFPTAAVPTNATFSNVANIGSPAGSITGSYSGGLTVSAANQYGGASGTGYFGTVTNSSYTLTLSASGGLPGVNYFGMWFSALDGGNQLQFFNGNTLLYSFTPATFQSLVGACPNASNAFCGNPNANFSGKDTGEQFAFLNFFDTTGYFNKIVFTETTTAGLESDNQTVGYMNPPTPTGTIIPNAPEPGSFILLLTGTLALMGLKRRFALNAIK